MPIKDYDHIWWYFRGAQQRKDSTDSNHSGADHPAELVRTKTLQSLHIKFNSETGSLLPLALRLAYAC